MTLHLSCHPSTPSQPNERERERPKPRKPSLQPRRPLLPACSSDWEIASHRKQVPTYKACELDIAEVASEEEGSNDADFIPEAIPLPNLDNRSSSTESVPVEVPLKHGRGKPPKKKEEAKMHTLPDFHLL